jgi:hypothetical protein
MTVFDYYLIMNLSHDGLPGEEKCRPTALDARPLRQTATL